MRHAGLAIGCALVLGCSSGTSGGGDTGPADLGTDAAMESAVDVPAADVPPADLPLTDVPAADTGNYYLPAGCTLTPFLSDDQQLTFDQADMVLATGRDYLAVIETDVGRMVLDLYERQTPVTVNSFVFLALHHYFDGIAFHRVIANFMAQTGDPNTLDESARASWGSGGPGYMFGLEVDAGLNFDGRGVVGMARTSNPNSNGSQFFITFTAYPSLNGQYTVFAHLVEGDDTLGHITLGQPPATPTRMQRVYIVERPGD